MPHKNYGGVPPGRRSRRVDDARDRERHVFLLPQAVEDYKRKLADLLEGERYGDAVRLLAFLLQCGGAAEHWHGQWRELKRALEPLCPSELGDGPETADDTGSSHGRTGDTRDEEEAWLRGVVARRSAADEMYADRLLAVLVESDDPERQLTALGLLRYLDHPGVVPALRAWLSGRECHPLVQFRTLKALRAQGATGRVEVRRDGGVFAVTAEDVPLRPEDFPPEVRRVGERVRLVAESVDPSLARFAEEMWMECVQAAYGTSAYAEMMNAGEAEAGVWAAALHRLVAERLHGTADDAAVRELYAITDTLRDRYERALRWLRQYADKGVTER